MSRIVASSLLGNILEETGHFSIRREKLACKRESVLGPSFQPVGVRLMPKV